jgi:hypothetical protein
MLRFTPLVQKKLRYELVDVKQPNLLREQFPYSEVPRILFENRQVTPSPAKEIWITDTTFRDGQQSRPPYSPEHIEHLYDLMNKLGGPNGIIRQCEFFVYSKKDQEAIERCMAPRTPIP